MRSQPHYTSAQTGRFISMDLDTPTIDFLALARSMGMTGQRITRAGEIGETVSRAVASGTANLIEIAVCTE